MDLRNLRKMRKKELKTSIFFIFASIVLIYNIIREKTDFQILNNSENIRKGDRNQR